MISSILCLPCLGLLCYIDRPFKDSPASTRTTSGNECYGTYVINAVWINMPYLIN